MSDLAISLGFEYINDTDASRAAAAQAKWITRQEAKQARAYRLIVRRVLNRAGVRRVLAWV